MCAWRCVAQDVEVESGRKRYWLYVGRFGEAIARRDVNARVRVRTVAQVKAFVVESRLSLIVDVTVVARRTSAYGGECERFLRRMKVLRSPSVLDASCIL